MNRRRCLGAATLIFLLVVVSPGMSSPFRKTPLVGNASAQGASPSNNQTGWGDFSVTITSSNETFTWTGSYTLTACTTPPIQQSGPETWAGCGYAVGPFEGRISGVACDTHLQYAWSVNVTVSYNGSSISLEIAVAGPVGGFVTLGCGTHNNFVLPSLIPTYCCNGSGLVVSNGALSGEATYSKTGTDAAELPGFTVRWSGLVSIGPAQVLTNTTPEFNANALAFAVIMPLAVAAVIMRRAAHKPALEHAND